MRGGVEAGLRIGLGKQQQDDFYTAADNVSRRQLEVELQACEPEERTRRREVPHTFFAILQKPLGNQGSDDACHRVSKPHMGAAMLRKVTPPSACICCTSEPA